MSKPSPLHHRSNHLQNPLRNVFRLANSISLFHWTYHRTNLRCMILHFNILGFLFHGVFLYWTNRYTQNKRNPAGRSKRLHLLLNHCSSNLCINNHLSKNTHIRGFCLQAKSPGRFLHLSMLVHLHLGVSHFWKFRDIHSNALFRHMDMLDGLSLQNCHTQSNHGTKVHLIFWALLVHAKSRFLSTILQSSKHLDMNPSFKQFLRECEHLLLLFHLRSIQILLNQPQTVLLIKSFVFTTPSQKLVRICI